MNAWRIKIAVFLNYFLFGILLNSVGTVILQVQHFYNVTESAASVLEAFKDLTIAIVSFIVASYIIRIGYKRSMLIGLASVAAACFILPSVQTFMAVKLLFAVTGAGFAFTKIAVFGSIGLVTNNSKEHISMMNFLESGFMAGVLSGYFIFGAFIDDTHPGSASWFHFYYLIGSLFVLAFCWLLAAPLNETGAKADPSDAGGNDFTAMLKLALLPLVLSFIVCAFLYVLLEQSIMSWLPTFNYKVLKLPSSFSVIMASIMAASTALGRLAAGILLRKFIWVNVLTACLLMASLLVLVALPLSENATTGAVVHWTDIPLAAYIFPLIGFFLAPIYPAINSVILASLPKHKHGAMSGLIVLFSALGGSLGSIITGAIFQRYGGQTAFYFSLVPIGLLLIALIVFNKSIAVKKPIANH